MATNTEKPHNGQNRDYKGYFKKLQNEIKEENEKGRELCKSKSKKVYDEKHFVSMSDEELFNESNEELIKEVLKKLNICTDTTCNEPRCQNLFYLYTNKKVGSTCLWGSINLYLSKIFRTFHYHNIGDLEREKVYGLTITQLFKILKKYNKNVVVIDIYRPSFDICVSNYFNELNIHFQRDFDIYPEFENKDTFIHRFLNLFEHYYEKHNVDYFKEIYDIPTDTFTEFDFEKKHLIYQDGSIKYIKLRLCDSNEWNTILEPYLNGYKFKVIKQNETKTKSWGQYYDYFNEKFFVTSKIYDKIKDNEYFKFYYSEEEQEKYLKKFEDRIKDESQFGFSDKDIVFYYSILNKNETKEILSYLSLQSNAPITGNCPCNGCEIHRKELIRNQSLENVNKKETANENEKEKSKQLQTNNNRHFIINRNQQKRHLGILNFAN